MSDGSKIITFINQFDKAMELAGITYDSKGYKFSLYSLRHTYAVDAIRRGISAYEIVRNMGTSLEILQKYYAKHALTSDTATRLGIDKGKIIMAFIEKLMSLDELIDSINTMPMHDEVEFFRQNLTLITRELHTEFRDLDDKSDDTNPDEDWTELND
jgi:hypothetical protein